MRLVEDRLLDLSLAVGAILKAILSQENFYNLIGDSKKLSEKKRKVAFKFLQNLKKECIIDYHLGMANVEEIDKFNILEATKLSMKRVVDKFNLQNAQLIIDGNFSLNYKSYKEQSVIKGDDKSLSIACGIYHSKSTP